MCPERALCTPAALSAARLEHRSSAPQERANNQTGAVSPAPAAGAAAAATCQLARRSVRRGESGSGRRWQSESESGSGSPGQRIRIHFLVSTTVHTAILRCARWCLQGSGSGCAARAIRIHFHFHFATCAHFHFRPGERTVGQVGTSRQQLHQRRARATLHLFDCLPALGARSTCARVARRSAPRACTVRARGTLQL